MPYQNTKYHFLEERAPKAEVLLVGAAAEGKEAILEAEAREASRRKETEEKLHDKTLQAESNS